MLGLPQGGTEDQMGRSIVRQCLYPCFLSRLIFLLINAIPRRAHLSAQSSLAVFIPATPPIISAVILFS